MVSFQTFSFIVLILTSTIFVNGNDISEMTMEDIQNQLNDLSSRVQDVEKKNEDLIRKHWFDEITWNLFLNFRRRRWRRRSSYSEIKSSNHCIIICKYHNLTRFFFFSNILGEEGEDDEDGGEGEDGEEEEGEEEEDDE